MSLFLGKSTLAIPNVPSLHMPKTASKSNLPVRFPETKVKLTGLKCLDLLPSLSNHGCNSYRDSSPAFHNHPKLRVPSQGHLPKLSAHLEHIIITHGLSQVEISQETPDSSPASLQVALLSILPGGEELTFPWLHLQVPQCPKQGTALTSQASVTSPVRSL